MLSNQGVVAVSDTGVQVVSREIEPSIIPLLVFSTLSSYTTGCAYESDRTYMLSTMSESDDTEPTQTFVYNIFTRAWTRYTYGFTAAVVENSADKMYFSKADEVSIYRERKSFDDTDYADPEFTITITDITGTDVTFSSSTTPVAGAVISQAGTSIATESIEELGGGVYLATMIYTPPAAWSTASATMYPGIPMTLVYDSWSAGQPGLLKHVRQMDILADNITGNNNTTAITATFQTDLDNNTEEVPIESASYRWGSAPWGEFPWGGVNDTYAYPTFVSRNKQYCRILNAGIKHQRAFERLAITGISLTFDVISERVSK